MTRFLTIAGGVIAAAGLFGLTSCTCSTEAVCEEPCGPAVQTTAVATTKECGGYVLIPAEYENVCEEVCVQPASVRKEHVEAVYENRCDTVLDTPGRWVETACPPVTKEICERVMVKPARREWKKVPCVNVNLRPGEKAGDMYCEVELPPEFENRTRTIVASPGTTKREWIPPTYKQVERKILVSAAYEKEIPCPANFESRSKQVLVREAHWEWRWGNECPTGEGPLPATAVANIPSPPPPVPLGSTDVHMNSAGSVPSGDRPVN